MGISLGKVAAIAAGIGAVGVGGYLLFKDKGDKEAEQADGAAPDPNAIAGDPAAAGGALTGPTAGTPVDPTAGAGGQALGPGAGAGTGQGQAQGEQVGPYTVIPDPQTGMSLVLETATQQPVGVMDQQGNVTPVTVDAQGKLVPVQEQPTATATGVPGAASPQVPTGTTTSVPGSATASVSDAERSAVYQQVATELFANAGNPAVGAAASDPMTGAATLSPAPNAQAGSVGASGPTTPAAAGAVTTPSTGGTVPSGGAPSLNSVGSNLQSRQVGEFTLIDDGSGVTLVLETATQQPVGMLDAAGNLTPISVDANGNVQVTGQPTPLNMPGGGAPQATGGAMPQTTGGAMPQGTTPQMVGSSPVGAPIG